jgi:hypothetical protein
VLHPPFLQSDATLHAAMHNPFGSEIHVRSEDDFYSLSSSSANFYQLLPFKFLLEMRRHEC